MAALARQRLTRLRGPTLSPARHDVTRSAIQAHHPAVWIHGMQQSVGNQTVQRLLHSGIVQAKLTLSEPGDQYEQEADQVAELVMQMPGPRTGASAGVAEPPQGIRIQ